jgi:TRAP-type mannitol/chloroaromatic compound transport system permease large subunit
VRRISLLGLIYIVIGIYIAWTRHYITVPLLKGVLQALLAVFLWFLILLGVNLHVR